MPGWLTWTVIATIVAAWAIATVASYFLPNVAVPPALNQLFMLIAGGVIAKAGLTTGKKDDDRQGGGQ